MAQSVLWLVQGTSTCTQCWSSSRPRSLRAISWAVTTPTSFLKLLLALLLWKGDHRVVQPRGESPFCKCPAAPVYPCYAVACVTLFFHGLLNVHLPWPVYCLCAMASCCCVTACLTSKCHGWCIFAVFWPACCSCAMACLLFMCMK